jgi:hypothetical protein
MKENKQNKTLARNDHAPANPGDSQQRLENATETFSGDQTCRHGKSVHIVAFRVLLQPEVCEKRANGHSNRVLKLRQDESLAQGQYLRIDFDL